MDGNLVYKGKKCWKRIFEFQILASKKLIYSLPERLQFAVFSQKWIFWKQNLKFKNPLPTFFTFIYKVSIHVVHIYITYNLSEKWKLKISSIRVSFSDRNFFSRIQKKS